ncbi:MAG: hypothetical protein AAFU80_19715 [Pseudomonadota bacterium]
MKTLFAALTAAPLLALAIPAAADPFVLDAASMDRVTAAGFVSFDTQVTKDVDILVDVDVDIFKNVVTTVSLEGNLATAEASADGIDGIANLAETETFAQTSSLGAFSFSQAIAASQF